MKQALLIIDMLNDFILPGAPLEVPGGRDIIPNIQREIQKAHDGGYPVFFLNDSHDPDDAEFKVWPIHAVKGTDGAKVVDGLTPTKKDIVIEKTRYDGFFKTDLDQQLAQMEITNVILVGVCTEICINYTASSAIMRGLKVHVPQDCVSALSDENGNAALRMITQVLQPS
jgi:nicotinamidase-related amidase